MTFPYILGKGAIYEPLFTLLGPQASIYDQLGIVPAANGERRPLTAPRNAYQATDGRWLGLSGTTQSIAVRVMRIVGRPDLIDEPCSSTTQGGSNTPMSWTRRSRPGSVGTRPLMQNVIPRLTATPGRIGHAGAALREHNVEILCGELGVTEEELASLTADGVVADVPAPVPSTGEDAE